MIKNIRDLIVLYLLFIVTSYLSLRIELSFLTFTLLNLGTLVLFLMLRTSIDTSKKILMVFVPFSIIGAIVLDSIGEPNGMWKLTSVFNIRFFNIVPVEAIVWAFFYTTFIVFSYENFIGTEVKKSKSSVNFKKLSLFLFYALVLAMVVSTFSIEKIFVYSYLVVASFFVIPTTLRMVRGDKKHYLQTLKLAFLLFPILFIHEVLGVIVGSWVFDGTYVYVLNVFNAAVPIEEIIFWMILSTPLLVGIYKKFTEGL